MKGFVYIMSNNAMPGIYKIGCTSRNPYTRAGDLYTTGVPSPFVVEYYVYVENYQTIEKLIHKNLYKYNYNKEFFKIDLIDCICELKNVVDNYDYDEKYKNNHLKSQVEGWEDSYILEVEKEKQRKLIAEMEMKKKAEAEELKSRRGCGNIMYGISVLSIIVGFAYNADHLLIITVITYLFGAYLRKDII